MLVASPVATKRQPNSYKLWIVHSFNHLKGQPMSVKVCSMFNPSNDAPFCMARHFLAKVLPGDFMWEVSYSPRSSQFDCYTAVATSVKSILYGSELGVILRFKITKDCELYASELLPSKSYSKGKCHTSTVSGDNYNQLKNELLKRIVKEWKFDLKEAGVRVEF